MDLILWRHAEAAEGAPDSERELTAKGVKQAEKVAEFLREHAPEDLRVLVSPAKRAQQTAAALTRHFTVAPAVGPGASANGILRAARWPEADGTVLVVGHQPTLGEVAAQLLGCGSTSLSIKKGALWWFSEREGSGPVALRLVIGPEIL